MNAPSLPLSVACVRCEERRRRGDGPDDSEGFGDAFAVDGDEYLKAEGQGQLTFDKFGAGLST